ncbi:RHS repeat-associated core domain-containing protein [Escherichia coli]|uniref:RHS repeat-associated core domain-containing protein n=1 Tax=Escherichia coli TaxID=562 RepID=UPI0034673656
MYYNRHRYYDPLQGRYITQDPIGLKGGWNFYQYPGNDSNLLIVFYVQIMPDDFVMQLHRF